MMSKHTQHDTWTDVLLEIRHANFEVFNAGFTITEEQGLEQGCAAIHMEDGTQWLAWPPFGERTTWLLEVLDD